MWVHSRHLRGLLKVGSSHWGYITPTFFGGGGGQYITPAFSGSPTWGATNVATTPLSCGFPKIGSNQRGYTVAAFAASPKWGAIGVVM